MTILEKIWSVIKKGLLTVGIFGAVVIGIAIGRGCGETEYVPITHDDDKLTEANKRIASLVKENSGLIASLRKATGLLREERPAVTQGTPDKPAINPVDHETALALLQGSLDVERLRFGDMIQWVYGYDFAFYFRVTRDSVEVITINPMLSAANGQQFQRVYRWPRRSDDFELLGTHQVVDPRVVGWRAYFETPIFQYGGLWAGARLDAMSGPYGFVSLDVRLFGLVNVEPYVNSLPGVGVGVKVRL